MAHLLNLLVICLSADRCFWITGQTAPYCLLLRSESPCRDVALAREIKRGGHRIWLGHGDQVVSKGRNAGFSDVWEMIAPTAYVQLGYSPWVLIGTCLGMLLVYVEPALPTILATGELRWGGAVCWTGMALAFQPTLWRYGRSPAWGLLLPVIGLFYLMATIGSTVRFYQGRGGQWKNRNYPAHG